MHLNNGDFSEAVDEAVYSSVIGPGRMRLPPFSVLCSRGFLEGSDFMPFATNVKEVP